MVELDIGLKRPSTLPLATVNFTIFGDNGRGESRSQDTSHSSSCNHGERVDVYSSCGFKSHNSHSSYRILGRRVRLLSSSVYSCPIVDNVHEGDRV